MNVDFAQTFCDYAGAMQVDGMGIQVTSLSVGPIEWELFDLQSDAQETRNVYDDPAYYEIRESLKLQLAEIRARVDDKPYEPGQIADRNTVTPPLDLPEGFLKMLPDWITNWT